MHDLFVSLGTFGISACVENDGPKELLEFNIFISCGKNILLLPWMDTVSLLKAVDLINSCIMHESIHQRSTVLRILLKEVLMACLFNYHIVYQDGKFVSEAFIVELISFLYHILEWSSQGDHNCLICCHRTYSFLAHNFH